MMKLTQALTSLVIVAALSSCGKGAPRPAQAGAAGPAKTEPTAKPSPSPSATAASPVTMPTLTPTAKPSASPSAAPSAAPAPMASTLPATKPSTTPAPAVSTVPAPAVSTVPAPAVSTVPAPSVSTVPAPAVSTVPAPAVSEVPAPLPSEAVPAPVASETPAPVASTTPEKVKEVVTLTTDNSDLNKRLTVKGSTTPFLALSHAEQLTILDGKPSELISYSSEPLSVAIEKPTLVMMADRAAQICRYIGFEGLANDTLKFEKTPVVEGSDTVYLAILGEDGEPVVQPFINSDKQQPAYFTSINCFRY